MVSKFTPVEWQDDIPGIQNGTLINKERMDTIQTQYLKTAGIQVLDALPSVPDSENNICIYDNLLWVWNGTAWTSFTEIGVGIADWSPNVTYRKFAVTMRSGTLYTSQTDGNVGNDPLTDDVNWTETAQNFRIRGSVETHDDLPEEPLRGDAYVVLDTGHLFMWDGEEWKDLGMLIDATYFETIENKVSLEDAVNEGQYPTALSVQTALDDLQNVIENETTERIISDNELRDDLDSEVTERIAGQSSLQGQININNTEIGNLQSSKEDRINRGATDGYAPLNNLRKIIMDYIITGTSAGTLPLLVAQVLDGEVLYYDALSGGIRSKTLENPIVVKGEVQTVANLPVTSTPGFTYRTIEPGMHEGQIVYWWTYSDSGVWLPSPFYIDVSVYQLVSNLVNELIRSGDNANVDTSHYPSTLCVSNIVDTLNNTIAGKASQTDLDMLSDTLSYLTDEVDVISNDVAVLQNKYAHHLSFMDTGANGHYITTTIINDNPTPFTDAQAAINYLRNYCGTTTTSQILASGSYYQTTTSTRVTVSALRGGAADAIFVLGFNAAGSYAGNNFTGASFTQFNDKVIRI